MSSTRSDQEETKAKKQGDLRAFFPPKRKRGRPKKKKTAPPIRDVDVASQSDSYSTVSTITTATSSTPRTNWNTDEAFPTLLAAMVAHVKKEKPPLGISLSVPRGTVTRMCSTFQEAAKANNVPLESVSRQMVYKGHDSLLTAEDIAFLQEVVKYRDEANNGMGRDEVVSLIMELKQTTNRKQCQNHYDYLIRKKVFTDLKRFGRVTKAQATTTKRSQITVEQQFRWHTTVDAVLKELERLNQPSIEFEPLKAHFWGNLDESCLHVDEGTVAVIASSSKAKTEKILSDSRSSITSIQVGFASGQQGPFIFLAKGKKIERMSLKDIEKRDGVPAGSHVAMSPSAYLTDEVWMALSPKLGLLSHWMDLDLM